MQSITAFLFILCLFLRSTAQTPPASLSSQQAADSIFSHIQFQIEALTDSQLVQTKSLEALLFAADMAFTELDFPKALHYYQEVVQASELSDKLPAQQQIVEINALLWKQSPDMFQLLDSLLQALDSLSFWQLYTGDVVGAEVNARRCLSLDSAYSAVYRWLAPSLLLQGSIEEAQAMYQTWKGVAWPGKEGGSFQKVFLQDLVRIESIEKYGEAFKEEIGTIRRLLKP